MLLTVEELRNRVDTDMPTLLQALSELTGRGGDNERYAWQRSLPRLADALSTSAMSQVHVHFARKQHHVALEYQLPGAASWCDVVLLGRHAGRASAVVVELKDWETNADRPGKAEGLVERRGLQELHPSDQVRGYVEYCRRFHSAVLESNALVHGFVLFTLGLMKHPYLVRPNEELAANYPIFSMADGDVSNVLPQFLSTRLTECDASFAAAFASGTYRQDRGFMQQVGRTIIDGDTRHFELLDNQRRALNLCLAEVTEAIADARVRKKVILVEGPPGSGKSAVAARLWASLVRDAETPAGNVVLVTTSQSQNSNWTHLVDRAAGFRVGRGVARKATSFPPLDIPRLAKLRSAERNADLYRNAEDWRSNLADLASRNVPPRPGAENDSCLVAIVDEAHALINPEAEHGVGQYGFVTGLGPQAFHVMRCSRVTVFFLDPDQSFRARENTTIADIDAWAGELDASVQKVSLQGVQFRCAGSPEYVAWVESLLSGGSEGLNRVYASAWYNPARERANTSAGNVIAFPSWTIREQPTQVAIGAESSGRYAVVHRTQLHTSMDFRVYDSPFEMEEELRKHAARFSVRLVSTYSRKWVTRDSTYPHQLPGEAMDFNELVVLPSGEKKRWSRPWNFVPGQDYTGFVAGRIGMPIHDDPLCEVGCPYAVRGFDFDYLGLLWLDDLAWRDGRWVSDLSKVHESGIGLLVRQARREGRVAPAGPRGVNLMEKVRQAYRILLTRAIKGMFVWIPDTETRNHVLASLDAG
jgi:uncharacterized protein